MGSSIGKPSPSNPFRSVLSFHAFYEAKFFENCNLKCSSCRSDRIFSKSIDKNVSHVLESIKQTYQNHDQDTQVFCDGSGDVFASLAYQNFLFGEDLLLC